ncbi:NAD(P)/FAD-dependent oxidoreductase [Microbacterium sp. 18062]|uniref:NAD(P)/FAD-dependent oxidoreductase n=1 Tax=Microbacterium sp. 18062 TaxID=2681410 RepID=UPI00135A1B81|nr:FAD-dependent oxidoreductase [Microbacterium sp. 18062]
MSRILIVGAGWAGFYTAWRLESLLNEGEAEVTLVDPLPYMTYQGILPEVVGGSIEPGHSVVPLRRNLKATRVITAKVTGIDHGHRRATITPEGDEPYELEYDQIVVTAGGVTRMFPMPGIAENAIGLKTVEEAVVIRDRLLGNVDTAAQLPPGTARDRLLTVVVIGGGFAGVEVFGELRSFATSLLEISPQLTIEDTHFHLIEATGRILPEVSEESGEWVLSELARRGGTVHLDTQVRSMVDGDVVLSTGEVIPSDLIVWTAGVMANPVVVKGSDLPADERGRIRARADLRVGDEDGIVEGAWAAGDIAAVPDLSGGGIGGYCAPNAQHAVRQGKLLARNLVAVLRGGEPEAYVHENLGAVAGFGHGQGVLQFRDRELRGPLAWLAHRVCHGLVTPTWERKLRVFSDWTEQHILGRSTASLARNRTQRDASEATGGGVKAGKDLVVPAPLPPAEENGPVAVGSP